MFCSFHGLCLLYIFSFSYLSFRKKNWELFTSFLRANLIILIDSNKSTLDIFFFYQDFLSRTLTTHRTAGEGRGPFFISTNSTRSPTFKHLFCNFYVRWLSHIYQAATRWDFTTLSNYRLIDWWREVCFSLFTQWFDTRFLWQQSWYR